MDRTIKLAAATSLLAVTAVGCTPNPYYNNGYNGYNNGYRAGTTTGTVVNRAAVSHTHCGRTHSHPLPPEGLAHHHGDGCMAGSGGATTTTTTTQPNYNYGYNQQQPAATTYNYSTPTSTPYYDYSGGNSGGSSNNTTSSTYDYSAYNAPKTTTSNTYRSATPAPVSAASASGYYTVKQGDTVFQVMRNTGVYWKDIIRLNNLQAPDYRIVPGQTLKLK